MLAVMCCCVCRRACPPTSPTAMTASPSSCASTSSCASEPSPPRGTSLPSTSEWAFTTGLLGRWKIKACVSRRYWEAVLEMLWPRFELILEMNIHSIRNTDPQKLGVLDTRPHYVGVHIAPIFGRSASTYVFADFRSPVVMLSFHLPLSASTKPFPTRGPTFCWDSCRYTRGLQTHPHHTPAEDFCVSLNCTFIG